MRDISWSAAWLMAGVLFAGVAQAMPPYGPGPGPYMPRPVAPPAANNPAVALRAGVDRLLGFLGSENPPSPEALDAFLSNEIAPFFDFEYMTSSAGGRLYERMEAEEQQALIEQVKTSFLGKMAEKLGGYDNQQVRFLPPRGGNDGRTAQVSVAVLNPGSYPARLDFRLYRSGGDWKVYDVSANGQSAIVHYRQQLMREMREQAMHQVRERQRLRMHQPRPAPMGQPPMAQPPMGPGMPPYGYGPMPPR
jgi:phospholipid transport system substrate-binding protein